MLSDIPTKKLINMLNDYPSNYDYVDEFLKRAENRDVTADEWLLFCKVKTKSSKLNNNSALINRINDNPDVYDLFELNNKLDNGELSHSEMNKVFGILLDLYGGG